MYFRVVLRKMVINECQSVRLENGILVVFLPMSQIVEILESYTESR